MSSGRQAVERALLIVNPAARGGRAAEAEAVAACRSAGIEVRVARTTGPGDAGRMAAAEPPDAAVLVLGGDGTVMEVVGATAGRGTPVGILPGGTGNQLARHFGIPLDLSRAARALARARPVQLDLGRLADGRYFALTAGLGLDAAIMAATGHAAKRRFGVAAYFWSAVRVLPRARAIRVRVEVDRQVFEREAWLAIVANVGSLMGGRLGLGPAVRPDDGWLDVCIFAPCNLREAIVMGARLVRGSVGADPRVSIVRGRRIRIEAPAGTPAEADGELIAGSVLDVEVVPGAATFLVPSIR